MVFVEYLIVTVTVSIVFAISLTKLGPQVVNNHHDMVTKLVEKAP